MADLLRQARAVLARYPQDDDAATVVNRIDALAQRAEGGKAVPLVQQTAPERIFLCVADDDFCRDEAFPRPWGEDLCWSTDQPVRVCVPYVRADLTHPPRAVSAVDACERVLARWDRQAAEHGVRTFTGNDHALFANELRAALTAAGVGVDRG